MSRLPIRFNFGSAIKTLSDQLYNQLNDSYFSIAAAVNVRPTIRVETGDPPAQSQANGGLSVGDIWINQTTDSAWIMTSRTSLESVTWKQIT